MNNKTAVYNISLDENTFTVRLSLAGGQLLQRTWRTNHHCNADYELHIILKGECSVSAGDSNHTLKGGTALLIAPGVYHKPSEASSDLCRVSISFTPTKGKAATAFKNEIQESVVFLPSAELLTYTRMLAAENEKSLPLKEGVQHSLVSLLTISLLRDLKLVTYIKPKNEKTLLDRTQLIDNFFETRFSEKIGCTDLAEELHMSTKQLSRILKKNYGMSFREKLISTRMDHAALLLRTTEERIQDVVEAVGYASYEAFYKAFTSRYGVNPQKYQAARKKP